MSVEQAKLPTIATKSKVVPRRPGSKKGGANQDAKENVLKPNVQASLKSISSTASQVEFATPEQTILIFDWDDTLCPSHWIRHHRPTLQFFKPPPKEERFTKPLKELEKKCKALLETALTLGKVLIVTNAVDPWVHTSCKNFLPGLLPIVEKIPVIYARSVYDKLNLSPTHRDAQEAGPGMYSANGTNKLSEINSLLAQQGDELAAFSSAVQAPQHWKELAFHQEISGFYSRYSHQSWKNVISIGDSIFERDAVRRVVLHHQTNNKKSRTKTAKLLEDPTIQELIQQVEVIHNALDKLVQYDGNLDIEIDEGDIPGDHESEEPWAGC
jgi:hypothetical protein